MKFRQAIFLAMILFLAACNDDEPKPLVFVTPTEINLTAKPGELIEFIVSVESEIKLSEFLMLTRLNNFPASTLLDSLLNRGKNFNMTYNFIVPDSLSSGDMIFIFQAYDDDGNLGEAARRVYFSSDETVLTETGPHIIYSNFSGKQNAFNITSGTPQNSTFTIDSLLDFKDNDTIDNLALTNSWLSPAGGKFVPFNGFDYANATDKTVREAYLAGTKIDVVNNLTQGDILLTMVASSAPARYAAIRISLVADEDSTENDRYEFYIKK